MIGPWYCFLPNTTNQINPKITNPPNTAIDQFILTIVGSTAVGKKEKKTLNTKKILENTFTARPNAWLIFQGPKCIVSPRIFLITMSMIGMRYDMNRPASVSETIALNAAVEPILMSPIRQGRTLQRTIARSGSAKVGLTCAR